MKISNICSIKALIFTFFFLTITYNTIAEELPPSPITPIDEISIYTSNAVQYGIKGPKNWFLYVQNAERTAIPLPKPIPSNLRAVFSPYPLEEKSKWPIKVPPLILLFETLNKNNRSLMELISEIYKDIPQKNIIEKPSLITIEGKQWVTATHVIFSGPENVFLQTTYITLHKNGFISIECTMPKEYYNEIHNILDAMVKNAKFNETYYTDLLFNN